MSAKAPKVACICTKCGQPCSVTESNYKARMRWCALCRQKQPSHWPEFNTWKAMIIRCTKPGSLRWHDYGGRGIKVCDRWLNSYENFLSDMGRRPSRTHSLDRINNDGNYEPENCRWATREEQYANMRSNRFVVLEGERVTISQAARRLGLKPNAIETRLARGWSMEKALSPLKREVRDERGRIKWV